MINVLLSLLADARLNRKSHMTDIDYRALYELSDQHQISALIYNQIYSFPDFPAELKERWKTEALKINAFQTMRTNRLLQIYKKLTEHDIRVIIVKGIICRSLYPQPDSRQSNDEDLYVSEKDFQKTKEILIKENFEMLHESSDVTTFLDMSSGLSIELHTSLFPKESHAYGSYQDLFSDAFSHTVVHQMQGGSILSLDHEYHFLFLMLHFTKHFLHSGAGIRQILDIVMYAERYGKYIDWKEVMDILKYYGLYDLTLSIFSIAHQYLEFDSTAAHLPENYIDNEDHQDLLEDIMNAGIFGQTSGERIHSSTITLNAAEKGNVNIIRSIFPSFQEMKDKYEYLKRYPFLLPISYISRIYHYIAGKNDSQKTVEIGQQRVELLKKYKVIK